MGDPPPGEGGTGLELRPLLYEGIKRLCESLRWRVWDSIVIKFLDYVFDFRLHTENKKPVQSTSLQHAFPVENDIKLKNLNGSTFLKSL